MNKRTHDKIILLKKQIKNKETSIIGANLTRDQCDLTQNIFKFYNDALDILEYSKLQYSEASFALLCSIVEGIAGLKYGRKYQPFEKWLLDNDLEIDKLRKTSSVDDFKDIIKKQSESYLEKYGSRRNFVELIIKSYALDKPKYPHFIFYETSKEKKDYTLSESKNRLCEHEFKKYLQLIYDEYRSQPLHQCNSIPFYSAISSIIGLSSGKLPVNNKNKWSVDVIDFAVIVLNVIDIYLNQMIQTNDH